MVALAEEGARAVAVEPLARRLGVTKGSFYWHFENREALWTAVLERWEQLAVDAVKKAVAAPDQPDHALAQLVSRVFDIGSPERRLVLRLEVALVGLAEHDAEVLAVYRRIMRRRLDYVVELYRQLGLPPQEAEHWGFLSFAALLGVYPALFADVIPPEAQTSYAKGMTTLLTPRTTGRTRSRPTRRKPSRRRGAD